MDQEKLLKDFFRDTWQVNSIDRALVAQVNALKPRRVLDVGCGNNLYKPLIPNLTGFDIVNPNADIVCDILDFQTSEQFDVILCLGSINFGGENDILPRLQKVRSWLAPGGTIFMRVNPGISWSEQPDLVMFPWDEEKIVSLGEKAGLKLSEPIIGKETARGLRYRFAYQAI